MDEYGVDLAACQEALDNDDGGDGTPMARDNGGKTMKDLTTWKEIEELSEDETSSVESAGNLKLLDKMASTRISGI